MIPTITASTHALRQAKSLITSILTPSVRGKNGSDHRFLCYIETHYDDPEITLSSIATTFECSKRHLVRCFRCFFATTSMKHLKRRRLEIAAQMVDSNCESLAHIAYGCGFKSYSQFCDEFRKTFGLTPSQRSKQRKESLISVSSLITDEPKKK